ncbi:rig [Drosophila busckii]|uniref:Rig n=1 Tax=Drosophila busckii TaxID=30019 RepID=A0A0M4EV38_DROBS|nr:rig [Drosophila busckii]
MNASIIHQSVPTPVCKQTPVSVATPDGGLLYTGFKCINYVAAPPTDGKHDIAGCGVKTMSTRITVNALDVSPLWGKIKNKSDGSLEKHGKHFATVAEDLSVQVWDCEVGEVIIGHKAHQHQHEARDVRVQPLINVMLSYMANGNILSIDASDLVIYCIASNSYCRRPTFVSPRNHQLTALRCSPYDENLFALGTAAGTVLICDLLKMSIVYKLSSHGPSASICSLAWREMSTIHGAIEEKKPEHDADKKIEQWRNSANAASKAPLLKSKATEADEPFDIYNFDHLESEFGAPAKVRSQRHSKSSDDVGDFVGLEKPTSNVNLDFMEACENMKADLRAQRTQTQAPPQMEVTLQDCQQSDVQCPRSDSESHNSQKQEHSESTEGSLELLQYSSSSDDAVIVDGEAPKPKREVLHHIYHQAEVHDAPESPQLKAAAQPAPVAASTDSLDKFSTISSKKPDMLLVSINANDVVQVWNANTGGHCAKNYNKSNATGKDKQVHWLSDQSIVCLSRQQLVFYMLEYDCKTHRYKIQKDQKLKCVAQDILTMSANTANQHIWLNLASRRVCSMNPRTGQFITLYGCLPLGVRAIAECPDDMNKIALGCSDKRLALFDISKLSTHCIQIDSLSVNSAVYALCWSPDCLELAYGTHDGIVSCDYNLFYQLKTRKLTFCRWAS